MINRLSLLRVKEKKILMEDDYKQMIHFRIAFLDSADKLLQKKVSRMKFGD